MSDFKDLLKAIDEGLEGKNEGASMGFERLNKYLSLRKKIYSLIFGATGSGKTAFVHSGYILHPFEWMKRSKSNIKLRFILFSMERSKVYTQAKWLSRFIFQNHGVIIPIPKLLGWWKDDKLTKDEHDLVLTAEDYFEELAEYCIIYEGARSPADIYRILKTYAEENGKEERESEFKKIYVPNNPHELVIPIADHIGLTKVTKEFKSKKEAIDKLSEHFQHFRDFFGYSPVAVAQLNRDLSNPLYQKQDSFEPNLDQVKETGRPGEDGDCVISLFDPIRYKTTDPSYGDSIHNFINKETGGKYFLIINILKNTYGEDDIRFGMAFHGGTGSFKELPKGKIVREEWKSEDFESVINGGYFCQ
jgi:hypothetical protein